MSERVQAVVADRVGLQRALHIRISLPALRIPKLASNQSAVGLKRFNRMREHELGRS